MASFALAASEENARGHLVITAPTGGSAGVMPAIVYALTQSGRSVPMDKIREGVLGAVLLTLVLIVLVAGYLLCIPFDDLFGICAGSPGNPAIVVAAGRLAPTERTDIGYAICFPSMTIIKIVAVQVFLS